MRQWRQRKNGPISGPMPNLSHHLGQTRGTRRPLKRSRPATRWQTHEQLRNPSWSSICVSMRIGLAHTTSWRHHVSWPKQVAEELCRFGGETTSDFSCNHDKPRLPLSSHLCLRFPGTWSPCLVRHVSKRSRSPRVPVARECRRGGRTLFHRKWISTNDTSSKFDTFIQF